MKIDSKNGLNDVENENKQKIWNIISKLPKNYFFLNNLKQFGVNKDNNNNNDLCSFININEIYILTYSLQCLYYFLFEKKINNEIIKDKNDYLNNFINLYCNFTSTVTEKILMSMDNGIPCLLGNIDIFDNFPYQVHF